MEKPVSFVACVDVQWFWEEYVSFRWPESCTKSHVRSTWILNKKRELLPLQRQSLAKERVPFFFIYISPKLWSITFCTTFRWAGARDGAIGLGDQWLAPTEEDFMSSETSNRILWILFWARQGSFQANRDILSDIPLHEKSARRDSNPRPRPWQGRAPPTEPLAHFLLFCALAEHKT